MSKITLYYGVRLYSNRIVNQDLSQATAVSEYDKINFILGDGINTELTLNDIPGADYSPSYLMVDGKQCWFVMSCYKQNAKQVTLQLRRDFLSEYWDTLKGQDFLVKKAYSIPDSVKNARYKKTMNLSQVKKQEWLLSDDDGRGWIVVYFNKNYTENTSDTSASVWTDHKAEIVSYEGDYKMTLLEGHVNCRTSPCDILAIPVGGTLHSNLSGQGDKEITLSFRNALGIVYSISSHFSGMITDIQYLPYVFTARRIDGRFDVDTNYYSRITDSQDDTQIVGWALWQSNAIFTKNIADNAFSKRQLIIVDPQDPTTNNTAQRKFEEEHMYRLCSPNFASSFEFSPTRNGGFPTFKVHGMLKPFNPYIYVEPSFGELYGKEFDDGRGLILSGDFSLDQVSNAWSSYKLQNKNYELIFNRQIQSMDLKNSIAEEQANWNIAGSYVNAMAGTASGALSGFMAGGPVGAVVGGVASAAGGAANVAQSYRSREWTRELNNDARSAAIDQFQYQTGNIQAIPNTLTKVSAITQDFKVFPLIEEYDCTEEEKTNYDYSVKYNGIDINEMATLNDFTKGFISGMIPVFPKTLNINQQQADTINYELSAGIYIKEV